MRKRNALRVLLCLLLCLGLGGCSMTRFSADVYVSGLLDQTYRGECDETYLALVDLSEEDVQQAYEEGLESELERFAGVFGLDTQRLGDDLREQFIEFLEHLYTYARWEVGPATRSESGAWLVEVTVRPVEYLALLRAEELPEFTQTFQQDHAQLGLEELEGAELEQALTSCAQEWAQGILDLCQGNIDRLVNGEEVTVAVRVAPDEQGVYRIGGADFAMVDGLILLYDGTYSGT